MTNTDQKQQKSIIIYQSEDGKVSFDVRYNQNTVWVTQQHMANLFDRDYKTISKHINNVFKEGELKKDSTVAKFEIVQKEGTRIIKRDIDHYSLDVIISVGYRVKSKRGTQFRQWAVQVLRDRILRHPEPDSYVRINAPITINISGDINIDANNASLVKVAVDSEELEKKKKALIHLLDKYLEVPECSNSYKTMINDYKSKINTLDEKTSKSHMLKRFIYELGDSNSFTHQVLNGTGVAKKLLVNGCNLGLGILRILGW